MIKFTFKRTQLIFGLLIALFIGKNASSQEWELVYSYIPGEPDVLREICFVPHNNWQTGWAALSGGLLLKTADGGENWTEINIPEIIPYINGMDFVNENVGFISTSSGQILKSIDGGYTWTEVYYNSAAWFYRIDFKDELHGVAGGTPSIMYTNDGGTTWNAASSPYAYDNIVYAGGDTYFGREMWDAKIGKSTDNGQTWTNILTPEETVPLPRAIDFYDENQGLIGGANQSMGLTMDGGQSWTYQTLGSGNGDLEDASYVDADTIYTSGSRVYRSINGGDTWFVDLDQTATTYWCVEATANGVVYVGADEFLSPGFQAKIYRRSSDVEFLSSDFMASETEFCEGSTIDFTDLSSGNVISWEWTFEGGTPATSNEQNPSVTYDTPGIYDVELTISDGIIEISNLKEDYISVQELPAQADAPVGDTDVCSNETSIYTSPGAAGATSYDWNFSPGSAGTITENGLEATVVWNPEFSGDAFISLSGFNACGEGPVSEVLIVDVEGVPMPEILGADLVCEGQVEDYSVDYHEGNSYVWEVNGGSITEGQGTSMVTVTWGEPGDGSLMVTEEASNGCMGEAEVFEVLIDDCTGINSYDQKDGVSVFPNPADDILNIHSQTEIIEVRLSKMDGSTSFAQQVYSKVASFSISGMSPGIYVLNIKLADESIKRNKLIIN